MPTFLTHPAVPLAMGLALGRKTAPPALTIAGVAVSVLPDLDILTWYMGIPLSHEYGHRGFSHSILFAVLAALIGARMLKAHKIPWPMAVGFLFISTISHGILDAFTNGGHGIAFYWPWSETRYFAPYRVIQIAPIHLERILPNRILVVLVSEIMWLWFPLLFLGLCSALTRRFVSGGIALLQTLSVQNKTIAAPSKSRVRPYLKPFINPKAYKSGE